ncbi:RNA polymerase, alpha subunit, C-terminal [uncultured Caudovirales phage]|uniref:RNA polymerase, alpha subunit, C-terminal n=1 Tax=uncultured Caudovirales phage TaxID=2100421 RepID=A0A6J5QDR9_9CAUD|nr:RNA polymerase, alpha subunit, C-terminal [uncultured Caudovirales phage]
MSEITLRDAIAIAAMQGLIQYMGCDPEAQFHGKEEKNKDVLTKSAYAYADAMLEERAKLPQGYYNDPRQNILIEDLVLTAYACNSLLGHGIKRVGDLIKLTKPELRAKHNIGKVTVREIEDILKCKGLCLRDR